MTCSRDFAAEYINSRRGNNAALAMSYVLWHEWEALFDPCEALQRGTVFPSLEKRFEHCSCGCQQKGAY